MLRFIYPFITLLLVSVIWGCAPQKPEPFMAGSIPDGTYDPGVWGKFFPAQYESWKKTGEPKPAGASKYQRGWDTDKIVYDRLSEFPYQALLFHGWGFGIEYNRPRGHAFAVIDQIEIDNSRTGPGGVCLACKTPYHKKFTDEKGMDYLTAKFNAALDMFPKKHRELGPACIDCHNNKTMELVIRNKNHINKGLGIIGKKDLSQQEKRILVCGQCHMTYYVPRNKKGKVAGDVTPPWTGAKWSSISIEKIIADLRTDYVREEWTQKVTGFRMPYIRHPEMEMFTKKSVHFNAGLSCADCHMPYKRSGPHKISDHNITSPLKDNMRACAQCHTESAHWLKKQVIKHQDRTVSILNRAGYQTAVVAKLFEMTHIHKKQGKAIDQKLYNSAKDYYMEAFLRVVFIGAENSTGFHNPSEALRVLGDATTFATKAEALLRQTLVKAGVEVPEHINLELAKYLNKRGKKHPEKNIFRANQEFKDPYDNQDRFLPRKYLGL